MGIKGQLRVVEDVGKKEHLSIFSNKRIAVDGYSWLHYSISSCAYDQYFKKPTDKYQQYLRRWTDLFISYKVIPVIIFDGAEFPLKCDTNTVRREYVVIHYSFYY